MKKLDKSFLLNQLKPLAVELNVFDVIDSTNRYLSLQPTDAKLRVCLTEQQTVGKGQSEKPWYSPYGENIYCSLSYPFNKLINELHGLSCAVGLAVIKALQPLKLLEVKIKWPNDIMIARKKCAGILIETTQTKQHCRAIIGIGININMSHEENHPIDQHWTSLKETTHQEHDRSAIAVTLIRTIYQYCERFQKNGFNDFQTEWKEHDYLDNHAIVIQRGNIPQRGTMIGVDNQGRLLLKLKDNSVQTYTSGQASITKPHP